MELKQIEIVLEKYFEGNSSIAEEKQLKTYFSSSDVAPHLEHYKAVFVYFKKQEEVQYAKVLPLQFKKQRNVKWLGIAAGFVFLFGIATFYFNQNSHNQNLGTFNNPEEALEATQKALMMVSLEVNKGIKGVATLQEYEQSRKTIFK